MKHGYGEYYSNTDTTYFGNWEYKRQQGIGRMISKGKAHWSRWDKGENMGYLDEEEIPMSSLEDKPIDYNEK